MAVEGEGEKAALEGRAAPQVGSPGQGERTVKATPVSGRSISAETARWAARPPIWRIRAFPENRPHRGRSPCRVLEL